MLGIAALGRLGVLRALHSRSFALLWVGQSISALGDGAFTTAIAWTVIARTGSAVALGSVLIARTVPMLVFLLIGGVAADRWPRRLVMLVSDGGRALAVLLIALLGWLGLLEIWQLIVLAALFGVVDGFFLPAYQSVTPSLVPVEALPSANSLSGLSRQLSILVGPLIGAALVATVGAQAAFGFDGLSFLASALCLLLIQSPPSTPATRPEGESPGVWGAVKGVFAEAHDGFTYVRASSWLWISLLVASIFNMCSVGAWEVAMPKLIRNVYHANVGLFGALASVCGVGVMCGMVAVGQVGPLRHRGIIAYAGLAIASVGLLVFGLPLPVAVLPAVALCASFVNGAGTGLFVVIWETVLQELVPAEALGRVSSVDLLGSFALQPLGFAVAGIMADRVGAAWVFLAAGSVNLALTLIALGVRAIRGLE